MHQEGLAHVTALVSECHKLSVRRRDLRHKGGPWQPSAWVTLRLRRGARRAGSCSGCAQRKGPCSLPPRAVQRAALVAVPGDAAVAAGVSSGLAPLGEACALPLPQLTFGLSVCVFL